VSCTLPTAYDVSLSANLSGSAAMKTANPIKTNQVYKLLAGSAHSNIEQRIAGTETMARTGNGSSGSYYGRSAWAQNVASGAFADAVTVTVTY